MIDAVVLIFLLLLGAVAIYVAIVFYANRTVRPYNGDIPVPEGGPDLPRAGERLSVLTWNIGYAALGKDADLIIDKGRSMRALSRPDILRAAKSIAAWLAARPAEVICLQENAEPGFLTRQVPVRGLIEQALNARLNLFWGDMKGVCVPRFMRLEHGMSLHSRNHLQSCTTLDLPQDDTFHLGLLKKHYGGMIARFPLAHSGKDWIVINLHLSAFDAKGHARLRQLQELMKFAQGEYENGHFVIIGGDWNMRLTPTDFAHHANSIDLEWSTDFPRHALPEGWQLAFDPKTPTVRALQEAYAAGETYTTILDGFVYAPNVALAQVATVDLGFAQSDHQPVEAEFIAKRAGGS